jgi:aspartate aminotransferase
VAKAIGSIVSHTTSNPTSFAQKGAMAAIKGPQDCVEEMCAEYERRRKFMLESLDGIPTLDYVRPDGAFYVLVNIAKTGMNSTEFTEKMLDEERVAAVPGLAFGDDQTIRLSYATSMENLEEGMKRLRRFLMG